MNSPRPDPIIPDHEVLRKIGGGAYGEVWLARGVTGALRAVKVLWREDFEDERSFEREFEGILKFEPISRDHPGMVNILHVGRSPDGKAFYYYVMELGDDVIAGRDINPVEYEARTLRSDTKRAPNRPLDTGFCIDVGVRLAEALRHLHDNGLAHRDVKPANVIFVAGRAKLADIGLVAARGQRTFVGTEGFVPPEGPGSSQADVYSLGKVLYEIATGKDRMEFPELPDELPVGSERKRWLALNQIICDTCEPHLSKRRISSAGDLADALRRLQEGKRRRRRRPIGAFIAVLMVAGLAVYGGWDMIQEHLFKPKPPVVVAKEARIRITSDPAGVDVWTEPREPGGEGELIGTTPTEPILTHVGDERVFILKKDGFKRVELPVKVPASAAEETLLVFQKMEFYSPPGFALEWYDQLGQRYRWLEDGHQAVLPVGEKEWLLYKKEKPAANGEILEVPEGDTKRRIVLTTPGDAQSFCWWLARTGREAGYLGDDHQVKPEMVDDFDAPGMSARAKKEGLRPFKPFVGNIPYASLVITTQPQGAIVTIRTEQDPEKTYQPAFGPLRIDTLKPGAVVVSVWLDGYKRAERKITLEEREQEELHFDLELRPESVVMDKDWTNSLDMKFVSLIGGEIRKGDLLASICETRVQDFDAYLRANPAANQTPRPQLFQGTNPEQHPVTSVSREEARKFCEWLTEKERKEERLTEIHRYRLPTDYEWSIMAGLNAEIPDVSPARRDLGVVLFPWGTGAEFPPVFNGEEVGNFADQSAIAAPGVVPSRTIANYNDGFATTAPVKSFKPNGHGIYDLSGNVQEWVEDNYSPNQNYGVLRGGSWRSHQASELYTGARYTPQMPDPSMDGGKEPADDTFGFRIVLAKEPPPKQETPPATNGPEDNG